MSLSSRLLPNSLLLLCGLLLPLAGLADAADKPAAKSARPAAKGASVAEAAKVLDLAKFPVMAGAENVSRRLAGLSYQVKGTVPEAFKFQQQKLAAQKWKELPDSYSTDQSASAAFANDGFKVSVSVFAAEPGKASVMLMQHGNVDLASLPLPPDTKLLYGGPLSTMYVTAAAVDKTQAACKKLLLAKGWEPYGTAGDVQFFKQNAVRLTASVSAAPAQDGKTAITYSAELMSADLPAPANAETVQYADSVPNLFFDSPDSQDKVVAYYRETLGKTGWEATTENPVKEQFKEWLIFRNKAKDLLTLELTEVEGKTRVLLKHESAAQVAELERQFQEAKRKKAETPAKKSAALAITIPAAAEEVEVDKAKIEFKLASGKGQAAVEAIRKELKAAGWKETMATVQAMFGTLEFSKGEQQVMIVYVDPGVIPAEITVSSTGVELERKKPAE